MATISGSILGSIHTFFKGNTITNADKPTYNTRVNAIAIFLHKSIFQGPPTTEGKSLNSSVCLSREPLTINQTSLTSPTPRRRPASRTWSYSRATSSSRLRCAERRTR